MAATELGIFQWAFMIAIAGIVFLAIIAWIAVTIGNILRAMDFGPLNEKRKRVLAKIAAQKGYELSDDILIIKRKGLTVQYMQDSRGNRFWGSTLGEYPQSHVFLGKTDAPMASKVLVQRALVKGDGSDDRVRTAALVASPDFDGIRNTNFYLLANNFLARGVVAGERAGRFRSGGTQFDLWVDKDRKLALQVYLKDNQADVLQVMHERNFKNIDEEGYAAQLAEFIERGVRIMEKTAEIAKG